MKNLFRYGPTKKMAKVATDLTWPLMTMGKRWSDYPVLKHFISLFFRYPHNEVTSIPIGVEVPRQGSVVVPTEAVERFVCEASHIVIFDECVCRKKFQCTNHPINIGCMALGKGAERIHPSHGRRATYDEAKAHVRRAAEAGLIANIAHVWIDVVAFGLPDFKHLMFICFCDDCCCMYRTDMKRPGPNLDRAYHRLPGISVRVDPKLCNGCGICAEGCFAAMVRIEDGAARILDSCKGCGRCVKACPTGALSLVMDDQDALFRRIMERVRKVADIS
ncbi:MAG: 4Fe-4S binding protein [Spirochaetes bacterium]|nr:4Fe-4S binding protein [Spirochaetota bacterium]